jgi:hypothetical protein
VAGPGLKAAEERPIGERLTALDLTRKSRYGAPFADTPNATTPSACAVTGSSWVYRALEQGVGGRAGRVGEYPAHAQSQEPICFSPYF